MTSLLVPLMLALALAAGTPAALAQENDSSPPLSGAPDSPAAKTSLADYKGGLDDRSP